MSLRCLTVCIVQQLHCSATVLKNIYPIYGVARNEPVYDIIGMNLNYSKCVLAIICGDPLLSYSLQCCHGSFDTRERLQLGSTMSTPATIHLESTDSCRMTKVAMGRGRTVKYFHVVEDTDRTIQQLTTIMTEGN